MTDVNEAPVVTSGPAFTAAENQTAAFTATASDVDGDALTYTLSGTDAALFAIDAATGVVSFLETPDFETPGDADEDNVYDVTVTASDGDLSTSQDVAITVTDVDDTPPDAPVILSIGLTNQLIDGDFQFLPTVTGTAEAGSTVELFDGMTSLGTAVAQADGAFIFSTALMNITGETLSATATDAAGNVSEVSSFSEEFGLDSEEFVEFLEEVDEEFDPSEIGGLETIALIEENTTDAFVATSLGEGTVFTLVGDDADLFTINQETGLVSFIDAPDFEAIFDTQTLGNILEDISEADDLGDLGFNLGVLARNDLLTGFQEVSVVVTDVNEFAPVFITPETLVSSGSFFIVSATDEDGTPIGAIRSFADGSGGFQSFFVDALTYEIIGGADADLFTIDVAQGGAVGLSGLLEFAGDTVPLDAPIDANGDGFYELEIQVSDGELTTTQTLNVSFVGNSEGAVFSDDTAFTIDELSTDTITQVNAVDPDGADVIYFLSTVADGEFFDINLSTGELSFVAPLSFSSPQDQNFDNVYEVFVGAFDGTGTEFQQIFVTLNDVNFAPELATGFQTEFLENQSINLSEFSPTFGLVTIDRDFDDVTATITGGADAALFTLTSNGFDFNEFQGFDLTTTEIFDFENPLDADGDNIYEVEITLSDGVIETIETLEFTILDAAESENAPVITSVDTATVAEGVFGTEVLALTATDADGETPFFFVSGGEDAGFFTVDFATGALVFDQNIAFNQPGDFNDNFYTVEVTANDGSSNLTTQVITVEVVDIDVAPTLIVPEPILIEEGIELSEFLFANEDFDNQNLTISLQGNDAAQFTLVNEFAGTGFAQATLQFISETDFEAPLDSDGDNIYDINVVVTDGVNTVTETVTITILDVFESLNAPIFTTPDTVTVGEGETFVQTVVATDADGETPTYFISGGDDQFNFNIDPDTGDLSFNFPVDFDENLFEDNVFSVEVTADDGTNNATVQTITVNVEDGDPAPSLFVSDTISVTENDTFSNFISARDDFDNQTVTITLGGPDAAFFVLANPFFGSFSSSARLELVAPLDFETPLDADGDNIYEVDVIASDGVNTTIETVSVTILDEFESANAPVFVSPATVTAFEGPSGTPVSTVLVTDADGESPTFSITGGADGFRFNINPETGELSLGRQIVFNPPGDRDDNFYTVEVTADDGSSNTTTQTITVEIQDTDVAPEFSFGALSRVIDENTEFSDFISGRDAFDDQVVTLTIGGPDGALFQLTDSFSGPGFAQGDLELVSPLDFETPLDADGDNVYELEIILSDGVNVVTELVSITVRDLFESPNAPVFTSPDTISVDEAQRFVTLLTAEDADGETVFFTVTGGADQRNFRIDQDGQLLFTNIGNGPAFADPSDFDGNNVYEVEITASDGTGNNTIQRLSITVEDVNVAPEFSIISTETTVDENDVRVSLFISARDNFDTDDTVTLSIGGMDGDLFEFDFLNLDGNSASADIMFIAPPDFELPGDANGDNVYEVDIIASDGVNDVTQTFSVVVEDVMEVGSVPVFTTPTDLSGDEGQLFITTLTASDADGDNVTFSIFTGPDRTRLEIGGPDSNELNFVSLFSVDNAFDRNSDNIFEVDILASDGTNEVIQRFSITLNDVNVAPRLFFDDGFIPENEITTGVNFGAQDPIDADDLLSVTLSGDDAEFFLVSSIGGSGSSLLTGQVRFIDPADFETPLDLNGDNVYELTVELSDGVNIVTEDITITVEDVEEIDAPPLLEVSGSMGTLEGTVETGITVTGEDLDGLNQVLTISLSGDDADFFSLTGSISDINPFASIEFNTAPDFEMPLDTDGDNIYELTVELSDGEDTVTQDITITIDDDPNEGGTIKSAPAEQVTVIDPVLVSFEVIDDHDILDLNETPETGVTLEDIYSAGFEEPSRFEAPEEQDLVPLTAEMDTSATDMQFAADLLLLQDSSAVIDG